jgi:hypothetical protein
MIMKAIQKSIMTASLLLVTLSASAQHATKLEGWMNDELIVLTDHGVEVTRSLGQERDIQKEGRPLKWRCDIYSFTLPQQRRNHLGEMIDTFEDFSHEDTNCYAINSMSESSDGNRVGNARNLMIGEDPNNYVIIGKDYTNFINVNVLDATDDTKTHRYAYALEWREAHKGKVDVRYIITYAKIPPTTVSITDQDGPYLILGRAKPRVDSPLLIHGNARVQWGDKIYPVQSLDSLIHEAQRMAQTKGLQARNSIDVWNNLISTWKDPLNHDNDPATDVIVRMQQGKPITSDDLLCNDNILLIFTLLKQQFVTGQNKEFNAISIYTLCKRARECGFFTYPVSSVDILGQDVQKAELDQLKRDILMMKTLTDDETVLNYLQMALTELEKIKGSGSD